MAQRLEDRMKAAEFKKQTASGATGFPPVPTFVPLVSIIINNYNYAAFLPAAIRSALDQDYPNTEVIVVDDGSTDGSREVVMGFGLAVRALFKKNGGQASAFNAGFAVSRGTIVLFLDADDVLYHEAVSAVVAHWREDLSRMQFHLRLINAAGQDIGMYMRKNLPSGDLSGAIRNGINPAMPTSGNAFARKTLEALLPMPESAWRIGADGYLLWLSPLLGPVYSLPCALGSYRLHSTNHSSSWRGSIASRLASEIANLERIEGAIREYLAARGETLPHGQPIWNGATGLRWRLATLALTGRSAAGFEDHAWRLGWSGMRAVLSTPLLPWPRRITQAGWFLMMGVLPRKIARCLAGLAFGRRPVDRFQRRLRSGAAATVLTG